MGAVIVGKGKGTLRAKLDDATFWRAFAGAMFWTVTAVWILAEFTGWVNDTAFVSRVSMPALQLACLSWWQSGRVEVKQQEDADVKEVIELLRRIHGNTGAHQVGDSTGSGSREGEGSQGTSPER